MNTPFEPKLPILSNQVEWQKELEERPVYPYFHTDKGTRYDVLVQEEDKHVIENERLGTMKTFPDPLATVLRYM